MTLEKADDEAKLKIVERALKNEHSEFILIKNITELKVAKILASATYTTYDSFQKAQKKAYKSYLKYIKQYNISDLFQSLIDYKLLKVCALFYKDEYNIIDSSIQEYYKYLRQGHLIKALFGEDRTDMQNYNELR